MQAIILDKPQQFRPLDCPEPAAPGPREVLAAVHRVGICGSDISGYLGKMPFYTYPRIPGHELGVEVLAVGDDVTELQPGDRCSVEPYMNCGSCFSCSTGHGNCCENLKVLGVMTDGGLRQRLLLPAHKLHKSQSLTYEQLALVETLAIGCHAVNRGQPVAGHHALVIGAGPIGLSVLEFLRLANATITVLDLAPQRLDFCRNVMGVEHTIHASSPQADLEKMKQITDAKLYSLVIDATGNHISMSTALQYVGFTGKLVFVGITTGEISFAHPLMHRREMTLMGSRNALPDDFKRIIKLIEDGQINTRPWITHRTPLADMIANFPAYTRPESGVIKAIVELT